MKDEDIDRGLLTANIPRRSIEKNFPRFFVITRPLSLRRGTGPALKVLKPSFIPQRRSAVDRDAAGALGGVFLHRRSAAWIAAPRSLLRSRAGMHDYP
jgi:hypothetical protein